MMSQLRQAWWRYWSETFKVQKDSAYLDIISDLIVPCHEDWFGLQSWHDNDNRRED